MGCVGQGRRVGGINITENCDGMGAGGGWGIIHTAPRCHPHFNSLSRAEGHQMDHSPLFSP
jgi:hypothetical protein